MKTSSIRPTKRALHQPGGATGIFIGAQHGLVTQITVLFLAASISWAKPVHSAVNSVALPSADKGKLWQAWQLYLKGGENNLKSAEKIAGQLVKSSKVKAADRCFAVQLRLARYKKDNAGAIPSALETELQKELEQATAKEPNNYYCFSVQADIYLTQGKAKQALTAAKQAYMLNPGDGSADPGDYISLFIMSLASPGSVKDFFNLKSARGDYFARFMKRSVHSPYVAMDAGHICQQNGRYKKALEYYTIADKLFGETQSVLVQFYIGLAHYRSGAKDKAKGFWKVWLAKDKSTFAPRGREHLRKLGVLDEQDNLKGGSPGKNPSSSGKGKGAKEKGAQSQDKGKGKKAVGNATNEQGTSKKTESGPNSKATTPSAPPAKSKGQ